MRNFNYFPLIMVDPSKNPKKKLLSSAGNIRENYFINISFYLFTHNIYIEKIPKEFLKKF
jgi:hypothetical protein